MYLFVYKTTHKNGKYYIGRHQTEDLNDGYLGSGKWVSSIKDKSTLSREILTEASTIEELFQLEEFYIDKHFDDPLCMNYIKGSNGWTSEDVIRMVPILSEKRSNIQSIRVENKTHNFLTREDGSSFASDMVKCGKHPALKRKDGTSIASDCVKNGTHNFLKKEDGTSVQTDRIRKGTHNLMKRKDGSSLSSDRVKNGTHHWLGVDNSGKNNPTYDCTIFNFVHKSGESFSGTQCDFYKKYNLFQSNVNRLVKGKFKSVKGWSIVNPD